MWNGHYSVTLSLLIVDILALILTYRTCTSYFLLVITVVLYKYAIVTISCSSLKRREYYTALHSVRQQTAVKEVTRPLPFLWNGVWPRETNAAM